MQSENQRALEAALAAYERAYAVASSAPTPSHGGASGGSVPELHEALDGAHTTAVQAALAEFGHQVRCPAPPPLGMEERRPADADN
jgi:hypothetical protein